jgi:nicotinate-nucleotide pyrophosphorylase (carboxylating)
MKPVPLGPLEPAVYLDLVRRALAEDTGGGDVTTEATVDPALRARGEIVAKCACVIAGLDVAVAVFRQLDPAVQVVIRKEDGSRCTHVDIVAEIHGTGIATLTRRFVDASGGRIAILDTRKTTPLLRALEKYAVRAGGGTNHREGLYDAVLIKDNHIRLAGGVKSAVERMRAARADLPIEVEAQSLAQVEEAIVAGADVILLDNMTTALLEEAVRRIAGRAKVEISGGVTLDRIPELAATGADFVSVGALTHSAPAADISLEIEPDA